MRDGEREAEEFDVCPQPNLIKPAGSRFYFPCASFPELRKNTLDFSTFFNVKTGAKSFGRYENRGRD